MWSLVILVSPCPQQVMQTVEGISHHWGHSRPKMSAEWKFMCATSIHGVWHVPVPGLGAEHFGKEQTQWGPGFLSVRADKQTNTNKCETWQVVVSAQKVSTAGQRLESYSGEQSMVALQLIGWRWPASCKGCMKWAESHADNRGCRGWSSWPCISQASQGPHRLCGIHVAAPPSKRASMSPCIWPCNLS